MDMQPPQGAKGRLIQRVVFGVFGNMGAGKDTVANVILNECRARKVRAKKFALADPLKRVAMELLGMPVEVAFGHADVAEREQLRQQWTKYGKNGRQWLQWIGTELGRDQVDQAVWIDRAVETVVCDEMGTEVFAIADCRFHNERIKLFERFTDRFVNFYTIRVHRPSVSVNLTHRSESELAEMPDELFNAVIVNDGTVDKIRERVREILTSTLPAA